VFHVKPASAAPTPPAAATALFGDRLPLAARYADWLAGPAVERGLVGPREVDRVWERHVLNCAVVAPLVRHGAAVADVGSGAGLPGLVLSIARPDLRVVLVEPLLRRADFLREVVDDLGLDRVEVVRARAEDLAGAGKDVVTARAVAPLQRLLEWTLPLLRPGGELLALKGSSVAEEVDRARPELERWRAEEAAVLQVGAEHLDQPTTVVRVRLPLPSGTAPEEST
jgi:16S rRNA (guanine527-N7)-methyltransferase